MTRFERWGVWSTSVATAVTGFVYLWMKYLMTPVDPWAVINHPLQPWVLKAHILVAPLLVFSMGMVALKHIWRHLRSARRTARRTGLTTALVLGPMVISGYLIQSVTGEGVLRALAIAHIATGTVYALGLLAHQVMVRRALRDSRGGVAAAPAAASAGGRSSRMTSVHHS
ncbi:MAG TPA: hypothetical protein VFK36_14625 [Gemmatimonadales bacterium]|nr:hypothetical protein [Gemmatimonadales bacterium]